jgi:hypothetical protein
MDCRIREAYKSEETHGDFPEVPRLHRLRSLLSVMPRFLSMLGPAKEQKLAYAGRPAIRVSRILDGEREQGFNVNPCSPIPSNHSFRCDYQMSFNPN